jgi:hypothetical protein
MSIGDQVFYPKTNNGAQRSYLHDILFDRALDYLQSMVYFQAIFTWLRLFVRRLEGMMGENLARAAENAREMMTSIQAKFDEMEVLLACIMVLAEIAYLYVENLTVFFSQEESAQSKAKQKT